MLKLRILGARAVIGEVERLVDQRIEIDLAALGRDPARVLQHALDDAVGAPAVLGDLFEIAGQHRDDFVEFGALVFGQPGDRRACGFLQLVEQFDRKPPGTFETTWTPERVYPQLLEGVRGI